MIGIRSSGLELCVEPRGARIARLRAPDRAGWWDEVAVGLADYADDRNFVGAIVGRYANRIGGGRFVLDGRDHVLPRNEPGATLHGGPDAFDRAIWQADDVRPDADGGAVTLRHVSPDGENGFPGTLRAAVTYSVRGPDLFVELEATTDAPTVVSLTQHAYFALDGGAGSVEDHEITVHADAYLPVDAELVPEGDPAPVEGTPFDLRRPVRLGERLRDPDPQLQRARGYDHTFVLAAPAAQAQTPRSPTTASPSGSVFIMEAPVGYRCGAYRRTSSPQDVVNYNHCGPTNIMIEIDHRNGPNMHDCILPWEHKELGPVSRIVHAWYNGETCGR